MKSNDWTPERDALLAELIAGPMTYAEICKQLGVSEWHMRARRKELGLVRPSGRRERVWTAEQDAQLRELRSEERPAKEIGSIMGVCPDRVLDRLAELGFPRLSGGSKGPRWTAEKDQRLRDLNADRLSIEKISAALGVTLAAASKRIKKLGLPRARYINQIIWDEDLDNALRNMRAQGVSIEACTIEMGFSREVVRKRIKQLNLPPVPQKRNKP